MKNLLIILIAFLALTGLTACSNTLNGFGEDLKNTGEWFENL